jgi:uncharacterized protein
MGKVLAWLVLIFLVLFALRVLARRGAGARGGGAPAQPAAQPMVRCARCGVFLPRAEATQIDGAYVCSAEGCVPHG